MRRLKTNPVVFGVSALVILMFLVAGVTVPDTLASAFTWLQGGIAGTFGWYYIIVVTGFVVFVIWLGTSRFGRLRLGPPESRPKYRYATWFAMLFTAGMGIGLVFWSVAEPLTHFGNPPISAPGTDAAREEAMQFTFLHWGLHAWAIYTLVGVSLGYFAYRHGLPLSIRSALYPLLGDRIHGRIGDVVDIFAVFGTMFGVATSLGFGVLQVNAGLASLGLVPQSTGVQLLLIAGITTAATASLLSGLDRGMLRLAVINLVLALLVLMFVLFTGPTVDVLSGVTQQVGHYVQTLPALALWTDQPNPSGWQAANTIFYWGWWISWAPFVGMFIARVSRGRTIREFVFGVLLVPVTLTFLWMGVFGNTAFAVDAATDGQLSAQVAEDPAIAMFGLLDQLPLATIMTVLAILLVAIYFVTSSDSASLVIDMITAGGRTDAPKIQRIFWSLLEGGIAAVLLLAGAGGLIALQTAAITTALPFSIIMIAMCIGLIRAVYADDRKLALSEVALSAKGHVPVPELPDEPSTPFADGVTGSP